jgi:putative Ca2+/H+ antiporter (TMEM165/GDT1 family)
LAEFGDKSTFLTLTLASQPGSRFVAVWAGSSIGMIVADAIAIVVGKLMGKRLPERLIRYGAGAVFIVIGVVRIVEAFRI